MRFIAGDRLGQVLQNRFERVERRDIGMSYSYDIQNADCHLVLTAPAGAAVGNGVHNLLLLRAETISTPEERSLEAENRMNLAFPFVSLFESNRTIRHYPISTEEIGSEADLLQILENTFNPNAPCFNPLGEPPESLNDFLTRIHGEKPGPFFVPKSGDRAGQIDIIPSIEGPTPGMCFLNIVCPEQWMEQAGVVERREALSYDNMYSLAFEWNYESAKAEGRTRMFKTQFAADWNRNYASKYWRLRACEIEDALIFRMPLCVSKVSRDNLGGFELNAIRRAADLVFEMPQIRFTVHQFDRTFKRIMDVVAAYTAAKLIGL
jgi:hypothetical protein